MGRRRTNLIHRNCRVTVIIDRSKFRTSTFLGPSIRVSDITHEKLTSLKKKNGSPSLNDVITDLLGSGKKKVKRSLF